MELYQQTVLSIALILLILSYVMIYYSMMDDDVKWPPTIAKCPDYWNYDSENDKCNHFANGNTYPDTTGAKLSEITKCEKYNWATTSGNPWDGLSYGVHQDC